MIIQGHFKQSYTECQQTGDFTFTEVSDKHYHLGFICPCGCGDWTGILVRKDGEHIRPAWGWNKDMQNPTCIPSILRLDNCKWHGYLKNGCFESC